MSAQGLDQGATQGADAAKRQSQAIASTKLPPVTGAERRLRTGTNDILDEARQVIENAVGQGQEISPIIYQYLGLQPQFEDNTQQLNDATQQHQQAQGQFQQAQDRVSQLTAIPHGKRTPAQRKELRQLNKQLPTLRDATSHAEASLGQLQTMPKRITGLTRMDPGSIPAESPFSSQNPLNKIEQQYQNTLQSALRGDYPVDPTLAHEYARQEQALRARLAAQYGPDYENSSVGQMAIQAFGKTKADAFATYNRNIIDQYSNLAFSGQANLQDLLAGRIGMMREPENTALAGGTSLLNAATARIPQENILQNERLAQARQTTTATQTNPFALAGVGVSAGAGAYGAKTIADALSGNQSQANTPTGIYAPNSGGPGASTFSMEGPPAPDTTGAGSSGTPGE